MDEKAAVLMKKNGFPFAQVELYVLALKISKIFFRINYYTNKMFNVFCPFPHTFLRKQFP